MQAVDKVGASHCAAPAVGCQCAAQRCGWAGSAGALFGQFAGSRSCCRCTVSARSCQQLRMTHCDALHGDLLSHMHCPVQCVPGCHRIESNAGCCMCTATVKFGTGEAVTLIQTCLVLGWYVSWLTFDGAAAQSTEGCLLVFGGLLQSLTLIHALHGEGVSVLCSYHQAT